MDNIETNSEIEKKSPLNECVAYQQPKENIGKLDENYYTILPNILINDLQDKKLKPLDLAVYAVFEGCRGGKKESWPGNKRVAKAVGTSVRNLNRCLTRLKAAGHISRNWDPSKVTRMTCLQTRVEKSKVVRLKQEVINTEVNGIEVTEMENAPITNQVKHEYILSDKPVEKISIRSLEDDSPPPYTIADYESEIEFKEDSSDDVPF